MSAIFGEILVFGQQQGPEIELRVYGDEFYARYETRDGFTVVYDLDRGLYCYARLESGAFVSTGTPTTKAAPLGIPRYLHESRDVRNAKFKARYAEIRPPEAPVFSGIARTFGPNNGLLSGRQVNRGQVRGLTILVEFDDMHANVSRDEVDAMLNALDYSGHHNFCSVRRYFQLMSGGKLDYTNDVVGPVRLSRKRSHYINNLLVKEALEIAIRDFGVRLSNYDSRGENTVDALSLMYAGRTQYSGKLWPHNSVTRLTDGVTTTNFYTIQSLGRSAVDLSIGTFTHESGHMLCRWPDLYDYGERDGDFEASSGLGKYCLMSSGNHLGGGKVPAPVCAYLRDLVDWCDDLVSLNNGGEFQAKHAEYGRVLKYATERPNEYFLVENRSQFGLDRYLPASGLAVYHCDTRGSNEHQDGTPENHYQCALLQADGRSDLERNVNRGDERDLFNDADGVVLASETVPDSLTWRGTDSGFAMRDIRVDGGTIHFVSGIPALPGGGSTLEAEVVADLIIPDDDPEGIVSVLSLSPTGQLTDIRVQVDITHTYRGDLHVQLVSPSGTSVALHSGTDGYLDDLNLDIGSTEHAGLQQLRGEPVAGDWLLRVQDRMHDDSGRLDRWGLAIDYETATTAVSGESAPGLAIPDDDRQGVTDQINLTGRGDIQELTISVDISHSYRGDLQLELVSPSGTRVLFHPADSDSSPNLVATYTSLGTPALAGLVGSGVGGDWTLHVRDLARFDTGTLNHWRLAATVSNGG